MIIAGQFVPETGITFKTVFIGSIMSLIINIGLWLSTMPFAQGHKIVACLLLFPSLVVNTLLLPVPYFGTVEASIVLGGTINLYALFVLFSRDVRRV
jgi:hypothetical protein